MTAQADLAHITSIFHPPQLTRHLAQLTVGMVSPSARYDISTTSLYFVRNGDVYNMEGKLSWAGLSGISWSSSAATYTSVISAVAYHFSFNATIVRPPEEAHNRRYAYPLRDL